MYDYDDNVLMAVSYELDQDLQVIRRKVYGFLDLLAAIGGLTGSLYSLFFAFILLMQYKIVISYVSNRLFLIKDGDEKDPKSSDDLKVQHEDSDSIDDKPVILKRIPIGFFAKIKLSFQRLCIIGGCGKWCSKFHTRRDRFAHMADKLCKEELKIIRWLQFMRRTNLAMKKLFTLQQLKDLEKEASFKTLAVDGETNEVVCL